MSNNRLTAINFAYIRKRQVYVNYRCTCGKTKIILRNNVQRGLVRSCGCLNAELVRARSTTHGMTGTLEYSCWQNMKIRCNNPSHAAYERYKNKGITVCAEWQNSFEQFFADMGPCPISKNSIDRIDNTKGYYKGNCRWATFVEQANNH